MTAQLVRSPRTVRLAGRTDRAAIEAMHARCSSESRRYRWRAPLAEIPERYLADALSGRPGHLCLLALDGPADSEDVIGFASAVDEGDHAWQLGVLVRDDRQRQGTGTALVAALIAKVQVAGGRALLAETAPNRLALLERLGRDRRMSIEHTCDGLRGMISLSAGASS